MCVREADRQTDRQTDPERGVFFLGWGGGVHVISCKGDQTFKDCLTFSQVLVSFLCIIILQTSCQKKTRSLEAGCAKQRINIPQMYKTN